MCASACVSVCVCGSAIGFFQNPMAVIQFDRINCHCRQSLHRQPLASFQPVSPVPSSYLDFSSYLVFA